MGCVNSRKLTQSQREANANIVAIFSGCHGMSSGTSTFAPTQVPTYRESSDSSRINGSSRNAIRLMDKKFSDKFDKGNGSVPYESYSYVEEEFQVEDMLFSNFCHQSLQDPPISRTNTNTSSGSFQSFEPTPLTKVLSQLYLGSEEDAQQVEKLIGLGITHIISIVGGGRYKDFYPKHMYIPLRDNGSSDLLEKLDDAYDFMMDSQQPGSKLFIHCQLGQNRSASIVIGFLMKSRNLSLHEAYTLLKEKRELIHPHKKYIEQLRQLDLKLHKVYSTPGSFLDIALCSKEDIKIRHLNFSPADSVRYKRRQKLRVKEDEDYLSSQSLLPSKVRNRNAVEHSTIYLPDLDAC